MVLLTIYLLISSTLWKKRIMISVISILVLFSNPALLKLALWNWEMHAVQVEKSTVYEGAIVLGGMVEWDSDAQRISCRRGVDRIWQTMRLFKAGNVKNILLSGDSGYVFDRDLKEADRLKNELIAFDFPKENLFTENLSRNTYENALFSKTIIDSLGWNKVLLVTSARHMRRAKAIFDKLEIECDVYPTDQETGNRLYIYWDEYFVPSGDTFFEWTNLFKEMIGYAVYDLKGYI